MIDKLLLNNQIITNKKKIKEARIQTINKLVQKIRKLKLLNEKKPQNAKITQKLEKIPKIMVCLKKLKIADIVRKILTFSKKPTAILTNGQASPDDIAIALLACNKKLVGIVETLKMLLSLNDANPGWRNEILELSKRKKKIIETSERKKKKKQPKTSIKKLPWKEEILNNNESDQGNNSLDAPVTKGWKEEPITETIVKPSTAKKEVQIKQKKPRISEKHDEPEEPIIEKPVTTVDSFFLTQTGENYISTVVIDRVQPEPIHDGLVRRERRGNKIRPNKNRNNYKRQTEFNAGEFEKRKHPVNRGRIEKKTDFGAKSLSNVADEKLHPSWAAKQKLKPTITEFKGQKITFDNDGNDTTVKSLNNFKKQENHPVKEKSNGSNQDALHPSWAAKQRQKPAITEFKGTKITFDD